MKDTPCARLWEIDPYRQGRLAAKSLESFHRHLRICAICRTQIGRDEKLGNLARQLPDSTPGDLTLRRLRTRLLRDAAIGATAPGSRARRVAVASVVVALGLGTWLLVAARLAPRSAVATNTPVVTVAPTAAASSFVPSSQGFAGSVVASSSARWSQTREGDVERVVIDDGSIRVHVRRQSSGERFLVVVPDGEIEVRGTTFDVSVEHAATARVHVDEGVVELRIHGRIATRLGAGEAWTAPIPPTISARQKPARTLRVPVLSAPLTVSAAPTQTDHRDVDYANAIDLLRNGQFDQAAAAFHALGQEQSASRAEDSSFLEAIALARAGRTDAAALVAERHLGSFPDSFHRKEASILVARAASRRGDCAKARTMMSPWIVDSPEPNVRTALGPCESTRIPEGERP
jgi:hypothetical protein